MPIFKLRIATVAAASCVLAATLAAAPPRQAAAVSVEADVDRLFARWTTESPGCAVGVAEKGRPVLQKAYGMADLEHDVRNTPDTIFEAGSVSKQFTAAAVLLLARDGKLSLEDPVRRFVPELPDYGAPLLIRHMLTHMSGLRDWGAVEAIAGWPRTSRAYTHAHVLDILSRQRALNFTPGAQYSYSNSGYNLAAVIVSRVSGVPFAQFTRDRIFQPLGMTHTSWRDDFRRVVKQRAIAYGAVTGGYSQDMPFENVHGNGGLLTTVGDLLRWNENFVEPRVGDAAFVRRQQEVGLFNDGKPGTYALGLVVDRYKGVREVGHSGSTAGYRAHLAWYPDQRVSVAVLCNAATAAATQYAHAVADLYLHDSLKEVPPATAPRPATTGAAPQFTSEQLEAFTGSYASEEAETTLRIVVDGRSLVLTRRPDTRIVMRPTGTDTFMAPSLGTIRFHRDPSGRIVDLGVSVDRVFDLRFQREPSGGPKR